MPRSWSLQATAKFFVYTLFVHHHTTASNPLPSSSAVWSAGGLNLFSDGSYSLEIQPTPLQKLLSNGTYALVCQGQPMLLTAGSVVVAPDKLSANVTLTASDESTVNTLSRSGTASACSGKRMVATFTYVPSLAALQFTQSFPDGMQFNVSQPSPQKVHLQPLGLSPSPGRLTTGFPFFPEAMPGSGTDNETLGYLSWGATQFFPAAWGFDGKGPYHSS